MQRLLRLKAVRVGRVWKINQPNVMTIVTSENIVYSFFVSELPVLAVYIIFCNLFQTEFIKTNFQKNLCWVFIFFYKGFFLSTNSRGQKVT